MLRNSDSRLDLALKNVFNFSCCSAMILKWLIFQCNESNFQTNTCSVGYTEPKWRRLDRQDVEEQGRSYRVTNYSAKLCNKVQRASIVLVSNVRLNKKTGNRRKRIGWTKHDKTGNGTERAKTRVGNGRRNGRDGNAQQTTHEKTRPTGRRRWTSS